VCDTEQTRFIILIVFYCFYPQKSSFATANMKELLSFIATHQHEENQLKARETFLKVFTGLKKIEKCKY
jgi:hypothetical protein